jgi:hypothetical protein
MPDYILLAHHDATIDGMHISSWDRYIKTLQDRGAFRGGSTIGAGACYRKIGTTAPLSSLVGFIRIYADNLAAAAQLLAGNPAFECGATIEIRELPTDD